MGGVNAEHVLELAAVDDQDPVEALAPECADPALGVRVGVWRSDRRADDRHAFAAEDLVEAAAKLAVAVVEEEAKGPLPIVEEHQQVPRLLCDPATIRIGHARDELNPAALERDEEEDIDSRQPDGLDGQEITCEIVAACWRRNRRQLALPRSAAPCTSSLIRGRPGRRCGYVQRRATSRRCQRSSVRGLTEKTAHACRGRARLSAVNNSRSASRSCGRRVWRRKIDSSCRSTRISNSFDPGDRQRSTTSSNRRRTTTYASDHSTRDLQRAGIADATRPRAQHRLDTGDRVFDPHARPNTCARSLARRTGTALHHAAAVGRPSAPRQGKPCACRWRNLWILPPGPSLA